jgi:DNA-binding transcriptional ArsR family regulator
MGFAETFRALSDPARRQILELLKEKGKMNAGEVSTYFDMTSATISYHLKMLKKADLVTESREKNYIYYALDTQILGEIQKWMAKLQQ